MDSQHTDLLTFPLPKKGRALPCWDLSVLMQVPDCYDVQSSELKSPCGIRPLYFEGLNYQGKPTRVFAWLGVPSDGGDSVPGIVLIHGGGGTAFHDWVKLWVDRGYAAIAIDTTGSTPEAVHGMEIPHPRHTYAGPAFDDGAFAAAMDSVTDQWMYHAVADTILAHSLLASLPEVDSQRIGISGVSWGGGISEIAVSLDDRFCFAAPVYGCGHLGENSYWLETDFQKLDPEIARRWIELWDPGMYLGNARLPMLFCNGTNDKHFRPDSWQKTYRDVRGPVTLSMKIRMPHDHPPAGDPAEILVFADSIVRQGSALPMIQEQGYSERAAWLRWESDVPIDSVEFVYTADEGNWVQREWHSLQATIKGSEQTAEVSIPTECSACYFNLIDTRGCIVSSEHFETKI